VEQLSQLVSELRSAQCVTVLTGSGISAESGIPTFRDVQTGLWARFRPEDLATPHAFHQNPSLVWDWYSWRRDMVLQASPNAGHIALVELEDWLVKRSDSFYLITQNVDGLHQRAGSRQVVELHGSLLRSKCSSEGTVFDDWPKGHGSPPACPQCGAFLRPDVVWFGETLPEQALQTAWKAAQNCDWFFSVGTSSLVEPAASLSSIALQNGATLVEINPAETHLSSRAHFSWRSPAGQALPVLLLALFGDQGKLVP